MQPRKAIWNDGDSYKEHKPIVTVIEFFRRPEVISGHTYNYEMARIITNEGNYIVVYASTLRDIGPA